jgi:hypothetical protein
MKKYAVLLVCLLIAACAPSKEERAESINILKQQLPNVESDLQNKLKSSKGFQEVCDGEWTYKVTGTKKHPIVAYGYFGHKSIGTYLWDWVKFLPTSLVGITVIPSWHNWVCHAWDVDIPSRTVKVHQGSLTFP